MTPNSERTPEKEVGTNLSYRIRSQTGDSKDRILIAPLPCINNMAIIYVDRIERGLIERLEYWKKKGDKEAIEQLEKCLKGHLRLYNVREQ